MKNIFKLLSLTLLSTFAGCVNSDEYKNPDLSGDCSDLTATKPVTVLTTPTPPTYPNYIQYTADDIIEAYVVSSDEGGNFYKSISFVSVDGLTGFPEAINAAFPKTEIQLCMIHQIRNSMRYVASKKQKAKRKQS